MRLLAVVIFLIFLSAPALAVTGVSPSPAAIEQSCLSEGGSWLDGSCTCQTAEESFTPRWGCAVITPPETCERTGGTWGTPAGEPAATEGLTDRCICPFGALSNEKGCDFTASAIIVIAAAAIVLYTAKRNPCRVLKSKPR